MGQPVPHAPLPSLPARTRRLTGTDAGYRNCRRRITMAQPIVAVVGRPNVGKSTLFNRLVGERVAIVEDTPGIMRDRVYGECEWRGRTFRVVDTGGLGM